MLERAKNPRWDLVGILSHLDTLHIAALVQSHTHLWQHILYKSTL